MSLASERIGVEFTTKYGEQVIVIDYLGANKVQIMFLDEHKWTTWTTWQNLQNGKVKNPFCKTVHGVGCLGVDKNGQIQKVSVESKLTREYTLWCHMLERCYSDKIHEEYPNYKNCEVCDRWKCYAYFLEDLPLIKNYELWRDNPKQRIALNKDIYYKELGIITDSKEYNLLTTRFITDSENSKEMLERRWGNEKE